MVVIKRVDCINNNNNPNTLNMDMERSDSVGRGLDWGSKACLFKAHQSHCVVFLSKTHLSNA